MGKRNLRCFGAFRHCKPIKGNWIDSCKGERGGGANTRIGVVLRLGRY